MLFIISLNFYHIIKLYKCAKQPNNSFFLFIITINQLYKIYNNMFVIIFQGSDKS
jgi:hypothetical protein